jgi:hypothetical protein
MEYLRISRRLCLRRSAKESRRVGEGTCNSFFHWLQQTSRVRLQTSNTEHHTSAPASGGLILLTLGRCFRPPTYVRRLLHTIFHSHASWLTMTLVQSLVDAAQDRPLLAFAVASVLIVVVVTYSTASQEYPSLPWIGRDDSKSFAATRATLSSITNVKDWLAEGYQKVR